MGGLCRHWYFNLLGWFVSRLPRKHRMSPFHSTFLTFSLLAFPNVMFAADELQLGFKLGSQLTDARSHASANGWSLRLLSEDLPNEWIVEGADGGLFVCDNRVLAVRRHLKGNIDNFASMVRDATISQGSPDTTVVTFMSGNVRISNIDARYEAEDGSGYSIQLHSTDGNVGISTNFWSAERCENKSK